MISRDRLIKTFTEMVQIDSPSGEEEDMAKKLTSLALKPTSVTDDWLETQWQTLYTRHHIACLSEDIDTLIKQADTMPLSTSEKKALHQLISEKNHLKTELSGSTQEA